MSQPTWFPYSLLMLTLTGGALALGCGSSTSFTGDGTGTGGAAAKAGIGNGGSGNSGSANAGSGNAGTGNAGSGNASQAGGTTTAGTGGVPTVTHIVGNCAADGDCVAVVDTRPSCSCGAPLAASKADAAVDACLVPWPSGSYGNPPPGCRDPNAPMCDIACMPMQGCAVPYCNTGKCALRTGATPTSCSGAAGAGGTDCNTLSNNFQTALKAAQQCNNALNRSPCDGTLKDACGCAIPYDKYSTGAKAAEDANAAWSASCPQAQCLVACKPSGVGICRTTGGSSMGTCGWAYPL